jgi:regulator of cell morphogenesis and NO signaling
VEPHVVTTIGEITAAAPSSIRVFQHYDIDFCCGAKRPLGVVCRERGLTFADVSAAIDKSSTTGSDETRDWSRESLGTMIGHILIAYHQPLRAELPRLEAMARKVAQVHGTNAPPLVRVAALVSELAAELAAHMRKEEMVLFPAIDALEVAALPPFVTISAPIADMEREHDHAGALLAELRALTNDHQPPTWSCATVRALHHGLAELEATMHVHVHLENNVLFPRALGLAHAAANA